MKTPPPPDIEPTLAPDEAAYYERRKREARENGDKVRRHMNECFSWFGWVVIAIAFGGSIFFGVYCLLRSSF